MLDKGKKDCATTILRTPPQPPHFSLVTTLCRQVPPRQPSPHFAPPTQLLFIHNATTTRVPTPSSPSPNSPPRPTACPFFSPNHWLPCRPVRPPLALQALPTILSSPARPLAPTQPEEKPIRYRPFGYICSIPTAEGLSPSFFVGFPPRQRAGSAVFCGLLLYLSVPKLGRALIKIF